ncbi:hypothetical protein [Campylobacter pinnipediorum]|nr:hypothetical protein [Campylobacter pinnipediorum]
MKKSMASILLMACFANAQQGYLSKHVEISKDGNVIGVATTLTPVEIISDNNGVANVKITGFVNENYQEKIVLDPVKYEEYAIFSKDGENATYEGGINPYIKNNGKIEDDYGEIWLKAEISFDVPKDSVVYDPNPLYAKAKGLYEQTCSACHHLHDTTEFTVGQWPAAIESMESAGYIVLESSQRDLITKFLQHNAKDVK